MNLIRDQEDIWQYLNEITAELRRIQARIKALEEKNKCSELQLEGN